VSVKQTNFHAPDSGLTHLFHGL